MLLLRLASPGFVMAALGHWERRKSAGLSSRALALPLVLPRARTQLKNPSLFHTHLQDQWAHGQCWG